MPAIEALNSQSESYHAMFGDLGDFSSHFFSLPFLIPDGLEGEMYSNDGHSLASNVHETSTAEVRAREIVCHLSAHYSSMMERGSGLQTTFDIQFAQVVFTAASLRHFVWGFFYYFHDQFPILHQPTFNIQTASVPLLLAVVLFGSMSSNPSDMAMSMRHFFNVAEAYVFDQLVSTQFLQQPYEARCNNQEIELLQAALLFLMLQNNSSDVVTRRRIRLHRIPSLVSAVRTSGLFAYKRQCLMNHKDRREWCAFVSDEVRVRLAMWTFMTDATLAVFFNSPPRVAISEMIGDLPCREDLFKAETAPQFERLVLLEHSALAISTLPEVMSVLLLGPVETPQIQAKQHISAADMLILICALQSIVMTSRMNCLSSSPNHEVILRALNRWKGLWDAISQRREDGSVPHKGFERHAAEYWWLVRMLLIVEQSGDISCRYMQPVPSDSAKDLHDFICRYKDHEL